MRWSDDERSWSYTPKRMLALGAITWLGSVAAVAIEQERWALDYRTALYATVAAVVVMAVFRWRWK